MMLTFKQFFLDNGFTDIHDMFDLMSVQINNGFSTNRGAIKFFIQNFEQIKNYSLTEKNKDLLYLILNTNFSMNGHVSANRFIDVNCFNSHFYYRCFEQSELTLIDIIQYFNKQINTFIHSGNFYKSFTYEAEHVMNAFFNQKQIKRKEVDSDLKSFSHATIILETKEYLIKNLGFKKLEALVHTNLFYGEEQHKLLTWMSSYQEKIHLENSVKIQEEHSKLQNKNKI